MTSGWLVVVTQTGMSVDTRSRKESETCLPVGPSRPVRDGPAVPPVGRPLPRRGLGRTGRPQGPRGIWEACTVAPLTPPATCEARGAPEKVPGMCCNNLRVAV